MIIAINYSNERFEVSRKYNTETAYKNGKVDKVIEYSPTDLDSNFKEENKKILSYKRGAGLWLWKPYLILKTLKEMTDGDYLFYCDSGAYYVNKVQHLIDALEKEKQDVMPFVTSLLERQFTKREAFELMGCHDFTKNQLVGSYMLFKKNANTISFVEEWLKYMQDERISSFEYFCPEIEEFPNFVAHREDQSVFSVLCYKKKLKIFRDPSNYGDRPWMYIRTGTEYVVPQFSSSPYPKIVVSNRIIEPKKYRKKEFVMNFLWKIGLFNKTTCFWMHGVKGQ